MDPGPPWCSSSLRYLPPQTVLLTTRSYPILSHARLYTFLNILIIQLSEKKTFFLSWILNNCRDIIFLKQQQRGQFVEENVKWPSLHAKVVKSDSQRYPSKLCLIRYEFVIKVINFENWQFLLVVYIYRKYQN